ncbi:hypothetical protein NECAME_12631, partial [Necator americanus]
KCLPKPPLPSLDHCLDRYLEYVGVVAEGQNRDVLSTVHAVEEFRKNGLTYQRRLQQLSESEVNWINQFWLPEMYLRIRLPLPVNISPAYIFPQQHFKDEEDWLRSTARNFPSEICCFLTHCIIFRYTVFLIRGMLEYKNKIDT